MQKAPGVTLGAFLGLLLHAFALRYQTLLVKNDAMCYAVRVAGNRYEK